MDLASQLREEGLLVGAVVLPHVEDHGARDHFHVLTDGSHEFIFFKLSLKTFILFNILLFLKVRDFRILCGKIS
jgi:hypothetical protein